MSESTRRTFLRNLGLGVGTAGIAGRTSLLPAARSLAATEPVSAKSLPDLERLSGTVDFRFSPLSWQTAYCFPDDHYKSLVGERGELRYGQPGQGAGIAYFPEVVEFSILGMEANEVHGQRLEAPGVPIVHTRLDRPEAFLELTAFATQRPGEGRVDNVILEIEPRTLHDTRVAPVVIVRTKREIKAQQSAGVTVLRLDNESGPPFLVADTSLSPHQDGAVFRSYQLKEGIAREGRPYRCFMRFPQEGQDIDKLSAGLLTPPLLLAEARDYWNSWNCSEGNVAWRLPGRHGEFLVACARNMQQAREVKEGRITFQVGPTVYRGLWVVDGNFILEAARYLGYDAEAQQGLEDNLEVSGGGRRHVRGRRARALEGHRHRHVHAGAPSRAQPGLELLPRDAAQRRRAP